MFYFLEIIVYSILRNNPKPAVSGWGQWAGEEELWFSIFAALYSVLCHFQNFIIFYLIWYSISTRTVQSVSRGDGQESDSIV